MGAVNDTRLYVKHPALLVAADKWCSEVIEFQTVGSGIRIISGIATRFANWTVAIGA